MKYFIDCGANNSCSARVFRKKFDPHNKYFIYSFEVQPEFLDNFHDIPKCILIPKAVWISNGIKRFYRAKGKDLLGATLIKHKKNIDHKRYFDVETIDFSTWIEHNFSKEDFIILKLDIEGAEYKVLNKMLEQGTIDYIDKLYIDWHSVKVGVSKEYQEDLIKKINIPIQEWKGFESARHVLGKDYLQEIEENKIKYFEDLEKEFDFEPIIKELQEYKESYFNELFEGSIIEITEKDFIYEEEKEAKKREELFVPFSFYGTFMPGSP